MIFTINSQKSLNGSILDLSSSSFRKRGPSSPDNFCLLKAFICLEVTVVAIFCFLCHMGLLFGITYAANNDPAFFAPFKLNYLVLIIDGE